MSDLMRAAVARLARETPVSVKDAERIVSDLLALGIPERYLLTATGAQVLTAWESCSLLWKELGRG